MSRLTLGLSRGMLPDTQYPIPNTRYLIPDTRYRPMIEPLETTTFASVPAPQESTLETVMLSEDKLFVVLAVVLVIWFGIVVLLFRNDRKIAALEQRISDERES